MDGKEVKKELGLSYDELCEYLLNKYGAAEYDYFLTKTCKSKNQKVTRTKEGLVCHHMDEDKAIQLSNPRFAVNNPYEYQKADRLVYCNPLEHLILHIKIAEEPKKAGANIIETQGIGGAIRFIIPELNHCYSGFIYTREFEKNLYDPLFKSFKEYISILKYWLKITKYPQIVTPEELSIDVYGRRVEKVYKAIK